MLQRLRLMAMLGPVLMMPEGDGAGGGGGGGAGGGTGLSDDVKKFVVDTVNAANANWAKRIEGKIPSIDSIRDGLGIKGSLADTIKEALAQGGTGGGGSGGGGGAGGSGGGDGGGGGGLSPEAKRELEKLAAKNKELEDRLKAGDEEKKAEREARLRGEEKSLLTQALTAKGVRPALIPAAVTYLTASGRIKRTDDGKIVWPAKRAAGYEDELDVDSGVTEWLASDEGKEYLPPVGNGGSGNTGGPKPKPGEKPTVQQANQAIANFMFGGGNGG